MQEFLYELLKDDVSSDVFILGDFNIDLAVKNQASLSFLNLMAQFNLHPIINQPTRITSSHSSMIDNVFTNYGIGGCPKGILYSDVSDHLPIFLCIPLNAKAVGGKNPYIKTRLINSENLKKANCLLQNIQGNMSDYGSDFESNFKKFLKTYLNCINLALPLVNKKNRFRRPWMNIDLYNLSLYKNVLYKRHLHNPSPANKNAYNKVKNKFINVKRFTEKKYFENKLKNQPGTKHRWRIINEILGSKKSCNKLFSNDASETAKLSTVTGLNKFFVEIGKNINKILGDGQLISNVGPYVVSNNPIFIPRDTTPDEIVSVITSATRQHGMLMSKKVRTSTYDRSWVAKGDVFLKLLWLAFLLGSTSYMVKWLYISLTDYYTYHIMTEYGEKIGKRISFPDITLCNLNPFARGELNEFSLNQFLKKLDDVEHRFFEITKYDPHVFRDVLLKSVKDSFKEMASVAGFIINTNRELMDSDDCPNFIFDCHFFGKNWLESSKKHIYKTLECKLLHLLHVGNQQCSSECAQSWNPSRPQTWLLTLKTSWKLLKLTENEYLKNICNCQTHLISASENDSDNVLFCGNFSFIESIVKSVLCLTYSFVWTQMSTFGNVKTRYSNLSNYYNEYIKDNITKNPFLSSTQLKESLLEIKFVMKQNFPYFQTDKPAYTSDMMIGTVRGTHSLWLGITVASAVEIVELAYLLCKRCWENISSSTIESLTIHTLFITVLTTDERINIPHLNIANELYTNDDSKTETNGCGHRKSGKVFVRSFQAVLCLHLK
ncbi:hypothetical protein HELRODRAFT_165875 [Helobdella robusta]|uniref:Endonuclease/exonuclease/phosphatase domain-containing protein n=1 Tax=Helobdella robusta TaxID=6412 RepID=T1EXE0_HELRO|nr:hypothetical protein HELRODRAFT_165875 [Helobdella robusta]ESN91795.1 hypothetical protein HELRODRAFT_165875 [Helobdella robusta]